MAAIFSFDVCSQETRLMNHVPPLREANVTGGGQIPVLQGHVLRLAEVGKVGVGVKRPILLRPFAVQTQMAGQDAGRTTRMAPDAAIQRQRFPTLITDNLLDGPLQMARLDIHPRPPEDVGSPAAASFPAAPSPTRAVPPEMSLQCRWHRCGSSIYPCRCQYDKSECPACCQRDGAGQAAAGQWRPGRGWWWPGCSHQFCNPVSPNRRSRGTKR